MLEKIIKTMMRYAQIRPLDVANGIGVHTTLFVSGCHFHCKGCFNAEYQDFELGKPFTDETVRQIISYLNNPVVPGFSLLGGEPFDQDPSVLFHLLQQVKTQTGKNIWVWSGYLYEELLFQYPGLLPLIDVLVDGQFILGKRNLKLAFRGSSNQRIIDVRKSLQSNQTILLEGDFECENKN